MRHQKTCAKVIIMITCILVNYFGKFIASNLNLPVWLDSFGTIVTAYLYGPVCGAFIGVTNNIIYGFVDPVSYVYGVVSIAIGIIVGLAAKKGCFENVFWTYTTGVLVTVVSVVLSAVLNIWFFQGTTGNMWGDGVIEYLDISGIPHTVSSIIGELYVDLLDKVCLLFLMYILLKLYRKYRSNGEKNVVKADKIAILAIAGLTMLLCNKIDARADKISNQPYVGTIYNGENGLSGGEANDIKHTPDGVLWIGTYAGLYRYNGSSFEHMSKYSSVKNVNCLYVDEEGRLWIGTNDNGVSICVNEEVVNIVDVTTGLPSNSVRSIIQSSDGLYYIGTSDSMQVISLNGGLKVLGTLDDVKYAMVTSADENGNIAAVSAAGELFVINNQKIMFRQKIGFGQEEYTCCYFAEDGTLYCGTSKNNVYRYKVAGSWLEKKTQIVCDELSNINALASDEDGGIIVCADNGVGHINENGKYSRIRTGNFNNSIDNMTFDYQGNMWFASSRLGLYRMSKSVFIDYYTELGFTNKVVNAVTKYNGYVYVGTDQGLDIVDLGRKCKIENELTEQLADKRIRNLEVDTNNDLWIATYSDGVWKVKGKEITIYNSSNSKIGDRSRVVLELSNGTIAVASDTGLAFIDNGEVVDFIDMGKEIGNSMILNLMESSDGSLFVGTDGDGLVEIKNRKVVRRLDRNTGLTSDVILRVVDDKKGYGYFVITSNGICYLTPSGGARELKNFPYSNNYDMWMDDSGQVFVLGSAGIYILDRDELVEDDINKFELLDARKGFTNALTANAWYYSDGRHLLLPCETGIVELDTKIVHGNIKSYRMMVSRVVIDNVSYDIERNEPIVIDNSVNKIEIKPEVLNFTSEEPYVQYYLEGFDDNKTVVSQNDLTSIVYTNLPSGDYVLHIAVLDSKNGKVLEESTYQFIKEKEIYENMWFKAYMIIVLVLAVVWLTWFIAKTQIQKTLEMQRKEIEFAKKQVEMGSQTILAIAKTVDAKDSNTANHSLRVSEYSVMIAKEYGFSHEECEKLRQIALLHDIGKIGVPDRILNKPDKLDDDEYAIMKTHVVKGAEVLKGFTIVENVAEGALYHHERYDGKGYISGLKGEEIPVNARIIGIADAFDAMTANRVYRKKIDFNHVLEELRKGRGTQFDPVFVDILLNLIETKKINVDELYSDTREE